jgi:hypothetical protein
MPPPVINTHNQPGPSDLHQSNSKLLDNSAPLVCASRNGNLVPLSNNINTPDQLGSSDLNQNDSNTVVSDPLVHEPKKKSSSLKVPKASKVIITWIAACIAGLGTAAISLSGAAEFLEALLLHGVITLGAAGTIATLGALSLLAGFISFLTNYETVPSGWGNFIKLWSGELRKDLLRRELDGLMDYLGRDDPEVDDFIKLESPEERDRYLKENNRFIDKVGKAHFKEEFIRFNKFKRDIENIEQESENLLDDINKDRVKYLEIIEKLTGIQGHLKSSLIKFNAVEAKQKNTTMDSAYDILHDIQYITNYLLHSDNIEDLEKKNYLKLLIEYLLMGKGNSLSTRVDSGKFPDDLKKFLKESFKNEKGNILYFKSELGYLSEHYSDSGNSHCVFLLELHRLNQEENELNQEKEELEEKLKSNKISLDEIKHKVNHEIDLLKKEEFRFKLKKINEEKEKLENNLKKNEILLSEISREERNRKINLLREEFFTWALKKDTDTNTDKKQNHEYFNGYFNATFKTWVEEKLLSQIVDRDILLLKTLGTLGMVVEGVFYSSFIAWIIIHGLPIALAAVFGASVVCPPIALFVIGISIGIIAGTAASLVLFNTLTSLFTSEIFSEVSKKFKTFFSYFKRQDEGWYRYIPRIIFLSLISSVIFAFSASILLIQLMTAAGTGYTAISATINSTFLLIQIVNGIGLGMIGVFDYLFRVQNSIESILKISRLFDSNRWQEIKQRIAQETWMQLINPFRLISTLIILPFKFVFLLFHNLCEALGNNKLSGVGVVLMTLLNIVSDFVTDLNFMTGRNFLDLAILLPMTPLLLASGLWDWLSRKTQDDTTLYDCVKNCFGDCPDLLFKVCVGTFILPLGIYWLKRPISDLFNYCSEWIDRHVNSSQLNVNSGQSNLDRLLNSDSKENHIDPDRLFTSSQNSLPFTDKFFSSQASRGNDDVVSECRLC